MAIKNFSAQFDSALDKIYARVTRLSRSTGNNIVRNLVDTTPVLTGRARGNWQVTIGAPASTSLASIRNAQATIGDAVLRLSALPELSASSRIDGYEYHITNNVHYIGGLNRGRSKKAPAGFVQRAMDAGFTNAVKSYGK